MKMYNVYRLYQKLSHKTNLHLPVIWPKKKKTNIQKVSYLSTQQKNPYTMYKIYVYSISSIKINMMIRNTQRFYKCIYLMVVCLSIVFVHYIFLSFICDISIKCNEG